MKDAGKDFFECDNEIVHGDFLSVARSLEDRRFDLVIADPPYNIGKDFGNNKDSMELEAYLAWTDKWISLSKQYLTDNGVIYIYGFSEILAHIAVRHPLKKQRWLVWHYTNKTVPGLKFWQRSHESILCLWQGKRPDLCIEQIREEYTEHYKKCIGKPRKETKCRFNQNGNGSIYNGHKNGALPRDVLKVPALAGGAGYSERWFLCHDCNSQIFPPQYIRDHDGHNIFKHPTQKPMELTKRLLLSCINGSGGTVLIPFAGSGSECIVAKSLGMRFFATELNGEYVDFAYKWLNHNEVLQCII